MSDFDPADFVDSDFQARKTQAGAAAMTGSGSSQRGPTREEVDSSILEAQQQLAAINRQREELERQRAALEETRRRHMEFQNGRQEMTQHLTRGVGLLEESEFTARREAEQMAKALTDFRDALSKLQSINEETWTKDNFDVELTRALTAIENARMEWNSARLKFPVLSGQAANAETPSAAAAPQQAILAERGFFELCKLGLALTWPLALVALGAAGVLIAVLLSR